MLPSAAAVSICAFWAASAASRAWASLSEPHHLSRASILLPGDERKPYSPTYARDKLAESQPDDVLAGSSRTGNSSADRRAASTWEPDANKSASVSEQHRKQQEIKAEEQKSVFGDVQLGVDVIADDIMWDMAKSSKNVREASSEEEPVMVNTSGDRFTICWDPLDGSSIVDNNWAVGTILGIWDAKKTGILGATGRDQVREQRDPIQEDVPRVQSGR